MFEARLAKAGTFKKAILTLCSMSQRCLLQIHETGLRFLAHNPIANIPIVLHISEQGFDHYNPDIPPEYAFVRVDFYFLAQDLRNFGDNDSIAFYLDPSTALLVLFDPDGNENSISDYPVQRANPPHVALNNIINGIYPYMYGIPSHWLHLFLVHCVNPAERNLTIIEWSNMRMIISKTMTKVFYKSAEETLAQTPMAAYCRFDFTDLYCIRPTLITGAALSDWTTLRTEHPNLGYNLSTAMVFNFNPFMLVAVFFPFASLVQPRVYTTSRAGTQNGTTLTTIHPSGTINH